VFSLHFRTPYGSFNYRVIISRVWLSLLCFYFFEKFSEERERRGLQPMNPRRGLSYVTFRRKIFPREGEWRGRESFNKAQGGHRRTVVVVVDVMEERFHADHSRPCRRALLFPSIPEV